MITLFLARIPSSRHTTTTQDERAHRRGLRRRIIARVTLSHTPARARASTAPRSGKRGGSSLERIARALHTFGPASGQVAAATATRRRPADVTGLVRGGAVRPRRGHRARPPQRDVVAVTMLTPPRPEPFRQLVGGVDKLSHRGRHLTTNAERFTREPVRDQGRTDLRVAKPKSRPGPSYNNNIVFWASNLWANIRACSPELRNVKDP